METQIKNRTIKFRVNEKEYHQFKLAHQYYGLDSISQTIRYLVAKAVQAAHSRKKKKRSK